MKKILLSIIVLGLITAYATPKVAGQVGTSSSAHIPQARLAGTFAVTTQGSNSACLKPDFSAFEDCTTPGAVTVQVNLVQAGQVFSDREGDSCGPFSVSFMPLGGSPALVTNTAVVVSKTTNYDPRTGTGDATFKNYSAGSCDGAVFSPAPGAVVRISGTTHFVISSNGNRIDSIQTTRTDALGPSDIGSFVISSVALRQ